MISSSHSIKGLGNANHDLKQDDFFSLIESKQSQSQFNVQEIINTPIDDSYTGPGLGIAKPLEEDDLSVDMTTEYLNHLTRLFKNGELIPKKHAMAILYKANQCFMDEGALVEIGFSREETSDTEFQDPEVEKITICGDTHGQFFDVVKIFRLVGAVNNEHAYVFNGDFVDRGSWSCEVALLLFSLKVLYPTKIYLNRGNHETRSMNSLHGFKDECEYKYGQKIFGLFEELFNSLPSATLVGQEILVLHGGLFNDDSISLDDIRKIKKTPFRQPIKHSIQYQMMWSDPQYVDGRSKNKRGAGIIKFGPDITKNFCQRNKIKVIIRSHEYKSGGFSIEHDGYLMTIFSAPNYCDNHGNYGAAIDITLNGNESHKFNVIKFRAAKHPDIPPMHYSKLKKS